MHLSRCCLRDRHPFLPSGLEGPYRIVGKSYGKASALSLSQAVEKGRIPLRKPKNTQLLKLSRIYSEFLEKSRSFVASTFLGLFFFTGVLCSAEDLSLNGTTYRNVTITRTEPDGIAFSHTNGLTKIKFADLSKQDLEFLLKKYHLTFDKERAESFSAHQKEVNDNIKEQIDSLKKESEQAPVHEIVKPVPNATPKAQPTPVDPEKLKKIAELKQKIKKLKDQINDIRNKNNQSEWKVAGRHHYRLPPNRIGDDRRVKGLKEKIEDIKKELNGMGVSTTFD